MIAPNTLVSRYSDLRPFIDEVERRAGDSIAKYCKDKHFPFISRVKNVESLSEKVESGRFKAFSEIDDLVGFTIIIPNMREEDAVRAKLESLFSVVKVKERKNTRKSPDVFRFDSTRIIARLPATEIKSFSRSVSDILFEVQVQTAFEHAWSVATHDLVYKTDQIDWKRFRLAAQIKAAVEQLDALIIGFESLAPQIPESPWEQLEQLTDICGVISKLIEQGFIPPELAPKDMSRFCENVLQLLNSSKKKPNILDALNAIRKYFIEADQSTVPRSVSLFQLIVGVLIDHGIISNRFTRYACHVTSELEQLFPGTSDIRPCFQYD